jgi:hypothetical protein
MDGRGEVKTGVAFSYFAQTIAISGQCFPVVRRGRHSFARVLTYPFLANVLLKLYRLSNRTQ